MSQLLRHLSLLTLAGLLVLFVNLGRPPLWDRDEPRNASCAREMMERGDAVVPTFNAELRVLKPVMKYWLMIAAYQLFGINEFSARFPSALFALACAWATYFIGRRLFSARAALFAALVLLTCVLFPMAGHMAKIDAGLTFFSTLALLAYVHAAFDAKGTFTSPIPSWGVWAMVYAFTGLAVLAKGLPGALPAGVLGVFLLILRVPPLVADGTSLTWPQRLLCILRPFAPLHFLRTFWLMRPLTAVVTVLAVAAPWYVLVGLYTDGEFLRGFFLVHHFGRATEAMENHSGPFLVYYLVTIIIGLFPWSVLLVALLVWLVGQLRLTSPRRAACIFLACWVGVYVVLFSCARTKLPGYIAPCFPALALLMGALLDDIAADVEAIRFWVKGAVATLAVAGVAVIATTLYAARFTPGVDSFAVLGVILAAGATVVFVMYTRRHALAASAALLLTAVAFSGTLFGYSLVRLGSHQGQAAVCAALHQQHDNLELGALGDFEPSWVFYARRPIAPLCLAAEAPPAESPWKVRFVPALAFFGGGDNRLILTNDRDYEYLRPLLPADAVVVAQTPRFLRKGQWLIIGHAPTTGVNPSTARASTR